MTTLSNPSLTLPHGPLPLPIFLPDATRAVVRSVDSTDLEQVGIEGLVMSTFHIMQHPGSSTVQSAGGLHAFTGWRGPIITDSGGFQIYSLLRENIKQGSLSDKGMVYRGENGEKILLTPEKSIQLQVSYGADIVFCLDDCTHVDESDTSQQEAVDRTIKWAKRCRTTFDSLMRQKKLPPERQPRLFGIVQGGGIPELRRQCAEALLEIGFEGYGYGGWPLDGEGNLLTEMIAYTRELIPPQFPMHALGVGHPYNVLQAARLGYAIFDSAMPTRDARHGRLYRFTAPPETITWDSTGWLGYVYMQDKKHIKDNAPVCDYTRNPITERYTRAYLNHLHTINDALFMRLATLHNLSFMVRLMKRIRELVAHA